MTREFNTGGPAAVPLYEYESRECKSRFEQLIYHDRTEVSCRKCGSPSVVQLLSTFAVAGATERVRAEAGLCGSCGAAERGMCAWR